MAVTLAVVGDTGPGPSSSAGHRSLPRCHRPAVAPHAAALLVWSRVTQIYFNPSCSKCRSALALLDERGIEAEVVRYLDTAPTRADLDRS